ncbi:MAG: hypothetical protein J5829_07335 [Lachnospiraceae bacterium]|nr:hypothetical protein [Lachnospiraceae bacterium]
MIYLDPTEYAKIVSEINTNYFKYRGKLTCQHISHGTDGKLYVYTFENSGFNDYYIIAKDRVVL